MKRATIQALRDKVSSLISIHALVKRATLPTVLNTVADTISIHALVKRATMFYKWDKMEIQDFNPRPREEGDLVSLSILYRVFVFQSTPS